MKHRPTALLMLLACTGEPPVGQADPVLALDHVFVLVPPGASLAKEALRDAGMTVQSEAIRHDGQGTASVSVAFANAYLELLWVDSTVYMDPEQEMGHERNRRGAGWRRADPSPFGIGLRRTSSAPDDLPFESRAHIADWMTPGTRIDVLAPPDVGHASPRVFVVPRDMGFDSFRDDVFGESPELFGHMLAERHLTAVEIVTPAGSEVQFFSDLDGLYGLSFRQGPEHLAELVFDNRRRGEQVDLRPRLPLILYY